MKVWYLDRIGNWEYDETKAQVVVAETEEEARKLATYALEGSIWTDSTKTTCKEVDLTKAAHILAHVKWG